MKAKTKDHNKFYTILIVEDSPTQALQVIRILEEEGFTTAFCRNGKEALSYLKERKPTIVISDIVMPGMDGYELCSTIKKDETLKDIPVILLTTLSSSEDIIKGLQSGADNFITKPYKKKFLLSRIHYILVNQEVRKKGTTEVDLNIYFMGQKHAITSNSMQIVDLLLSAYEHAVLQNQELKKTQAELETLNKQLEEKVKQRTQRIERLNSVLLAIRVINQLIVREKNRDCLIQKACENLISARDCHNAWIALIEESGELVTTAEAGLGKEFLPLQRLFKGGKLVNCARRALKKSGIVFIKDPSTACTDCPLAKESHARGAMAVRLEHGGKTFGLLSISIPKDLVRDKEGLSLFKEGAGDISFGLHNIEMEEQRKQGEEALRERTYEIGERVKELGCLYNIAMLIEKQEISLGEILQGTINIIPAAFQHPEITCARIILEGKEFRTENFREATWKLTQDIKSHGESIGTLEVSYLEQRPERDEGPFVKEACNLLTAVAGRLGHVIERKQAEDKLLESENKYRTLLENLPQKIFQKDRDSVFVSCNQNFARDLKIKPEEIKGKTDFEFFPKELAEKYRADDKRIVESRKTEDIEEKYVVDAQEIWVWTIKTPVKNEKGNITGILGIFWDITERKQAERALEKERKLLRTLIDNLPDYIFIKDNWSKFLMSNKAHLRAIGAATSEDIIGKTDFDFFPKELAAEYYEDEQKIVQSGEPLRSKEELVIVQGTGERKWLLTTKVSLRDREGKITGLVGISRDITDRKLAEQKIKEYAENLETMVEERTKELNRALYDTEQARDRIDGILKSVGDGLIVTDLYNRVILMNRAAEDLLSARLSDVIDRFIDFAIADRTLRERIKTTLDKRESGYQFDFKLPGDEPSHPRIIRGRTSLIEDKTGKHTGIITTMHDVTYEREVDRMKTEFISTAAHELRTPLTSIQGFSELLTTRDDITEGEKKECLSYINTQSVNLANIINDLLDISRIESEKGFSLNRVPCNISELIQKTVPYFQVQSKKHHFDLILPEEPIEVMVDIDKMRQVLENILSNAVKYSPEGGTIRLTAKAIGEWGMRNGELEGKADTSEIRIPQSAIEVRISDQGMGMSPEQVERIFDRFYRANASNTAIPGTGLGMSIVKYLVEAHGGEVWVESEVGKGTTVTFRIPAD